MIFFSEKSVKVIDFAGPETYHTSIPPGRYSMRKITIAGLLVIAGICRLYGENIVTCTIDARLIPDKNMVRATETVIWRNSSNRPVNTLMFHLYYNAFRSEKTTFLQEEGYYKKSKKELAKIRFGGVDIKSVTVSGQGDRTAALRYPFPDDGNEHDRTVMEIPLARPVFPGGKVAVSIDFNLRVPEIISRTGSADDYFFLAQWFPKPGVLMENGDWHCHQYHANSEYYADFGRFTVTLTVPKKFVVGATGSLFKKTENSDGTVSYTYTEKDIHDFAWTAWPEFITVKDSIRLPGNRKKVEITLLLSPLHRNARERYLKSAKHAMLFFAKNIFPYPYDTLTMVDAPLKGMQSWGMEYPTLITLGHASILPDFYRLAEMITIHEFGHQYWYGIIASDEMREAWLDEGINTFYELEIMEDYFNGEHEWFGMKPLQAHDWEKRRTPYTAMPMLDPIQTWSWKFLNYMTYRGNVYSRASLFLTSMKNLVGKDRLYEFFRRYGTLYRYRHPTTEDFTSLFNATLNEDFSWAFDQFLHGATGLDNTVYLVESFKTGDKEGTWRNEVVFTRNEGYFPVETAIVLEDGRTINETWTERKRWKRVVFHDTSPVKYAAVDPEYAIPLDTNLLNNSISRKGASTRFGPFYRNLGFMVQAIISMITF